MDNPVPVLLTCIHIRASSLHMRDLEQPETPENRPRDTGLKPVKYKLCQNECKKSCQIGLDYKKNDGLVR